MIECAICKSKFDTDYSEHLNEMLELEDTVIKRQLKYMHSHSDHPMFAAWMREHIALQRQRKYHLDALRSIEEHSDDDEILSNIMLEVGT